MSPPPSLLSTIASLFLPPCLRSESHSPSQRRNSKTIVCNQYGRRLYLRPIMPPTTRRQSRILTEGVEDMKERGVEDIQEGGGGSGEKSVAVGGDEEKGGANEYKMVFKTKGAVVGEQEEVLERKQSKITFDILPIRDIEKTTSEDGPMSATSPKSRTLSMEMHDAIEALNREEEGEEDLEPQQEQQLTDPTQPSDSSDSDSDSSSASDSSPSSPPTPTSPPTPSPPPRPSNLITFTGLSPSLPSETPRHTRAPKSAPEPLPPAQPWVMYYDCAHGCSEPVKLTQGEPIRCKSCGKRYLYKRRTNRMVQFEAR